MDTEAAELGSVERVPYGQQRANAAVSLLRLGEREKVLPVFDMTDDSEALTQFIFRCRDQGYERYICTRTKDPDDRETKTVQSSNN